MKKNIAESGTASGLHALLSGWEGGGIKLYVTSRALLYRRENHALFSEGTYLPLTGEGEHNEHVCAFARLGADRIVLVVVPRLIAGLLQFEDKAPFGKNVWGNTELIVPDEIRGDTFRNVITGENVVAVNRPGKRTLPLADIFASFPVAMLEGIIAPA